MAEDPRATQNTNLPGGDEDVAADGPSVITAIRSAKKEAEDSRRTRLALNRQNMQAYMGMQDFSYKDEGMSSEFLPKVGVATEQFAAFVKRALTQFGAWFDVELGRSSQSPLSEGQIAALIGGYLDNLAAPGGGHQAFPVVLTEGIKAGALESLPIFKVHGMRVPERVFSTQPGSPFINDDGIIEQSDDELTMETRMTWHLQIDVIRFEDYLKDPTGRGMYEIHTSEYDLYEIQDLAAEGVYNQAAVDELTADFSRPQQDKRPERVRGHDEGHKPDFRHKVVVDEYWGHLLDTNGNIVERNIVCAVANDRFLIREPEPNPLWHQESPFVAEPLIRVPFSVWHKAMMDHPTQLNFAMNEMFNLMLDGGLASVWGVRQVRTDDLEDPSEISDGIPQGATLGVKNTLPAGAKVVERVTQGEIPGDAMAIFELLNREFTMAALSNELKMGSLPAKKVLATEVVELSQSQAVVLDSMTADMEIGIIGQILRKSWLTILQHLDDASSEQIVSAIGVRGAFLISRMSKAKRFAMFAHHCSFKVHGLTAALSKARDFQKIMALLQSIVQNPLLLQAFFKRFSANKLLMYMMKTLQVNPENLQRSGEEMNRIDQELAELPKFQELLSRKQGGGAGPTAQNTGDNSLPAEINQAANPSTGLTGNA